jgi:hypothetical protein
MAEMELKTRADYLVPANISGCSSCVGQAET